jgi:hypothetical protein
MPDAAASQPPEPSSPVLVPDEPRHWQLRPFQRILTTDDIAALSTLRPKDAPIYWVAGSRVLNAAPNVPQLGATLVLEALNDYFLPARRMAEHLSSLLGRQIRINGYATPAHARGFAAHGHPAPSVLLQQMGIRHWHLAPPPAPALGARLRRHFDPPVLTAAQREGARARATSFWQHPGQALYLPTGWLHWSSPAPQFSVHLGIEWEGRFPGADRWPGGT